MANYFIKASFIIPCNADQSAIAIKSLEHIRDQATDYANTNLSKSGSEDLSPEERITHHCFFNHPEQESNDAMGGLDWKFAVEPAEEGLWVYADNSINTEHAAIFTQAVLKAFDIPSLVVIEAAHTCDQDKVDGFGGHACVVSKDFIRWGGLADFINTETKAHEGGERFYMCEITEVNGEYEYPRIFLMKCSAEDDPEDRLDDVFANHRGGGEQEGADFIWYSDGTSAKDPCMKEITPYEFKVMESHLSVR